MARTTSNITRAEWLQQQGYEAAMRGEPRTACPHSAHRTFYVSHWRKGWDKAMNEGVKVVDAIVKGEY